MLADDSLEDLYDPEFYLAAQNQNTNSLSDSLKAKGILDQQGRLDHNVVLKLAKTDPVIVYKKRYYSQSELDVYRLAYIKGEN